jgi:hypothetical protein
VAGDDQPTAVDAAPDPEVRAAIPSLTEHHLLVAPCVAEPVPVDPTMELLLVLRQIGKPMDDVDVIGPCPPRHRRAPAHDPRGLHEVERLRVDDAQLGILSATRLDEVRDLGSVRTRLGRGHCGGARWVEHHRIEQHSLCAVRQTHEVLAELLFREPPMEERQVTPNGRERHHARCELPQACAELCPPG